MFACISKYDIPTVVAFHLKLLYGFLTAEAKNKSKIDIIRLFTCQVRIERLTHHRVLSKSCSFLPSACSFVSMSYSVAVFVSSFRTRESGVLNGSFLFHFPLLTGQPVGHKCLCHLASSCHRFNHLSVCLCLFSLKRIGFLAHTLSMLLDMTFTIVILSKCIFNNVSALRTSLSLYSYSSQ